MSAMNSCLYDCTVSHQRLVQKQRYFKYRVHLFKLDLDEIDRLSRRSLFFRRGRFGLFSFHEHDHLRFYKELPESPLRKRLATFLQESGFQFRIGKVELLTTVRMLGYAFNPVCFYYIYDRDNRLVLILSEVTNTYHEQKPYILDVRQKNGIPNLKGEAPKDFYVSPFLPVERHFRFHFSPLQNDFGIQIDTVQKTESKSILELRAVLRGSRRSIKASRLWWAFFRFPLQGLRIMAAIHWQALKIFLQRIPYFSKETSDQSIRDRVQHPIEQLEFIQTIPEQKIEKANYKNSQLNQKHEENICHV